MSEKLLTTYKDTIMKYYVYKLIDPRDEKIFYIGKGTNNRMTYHVRQVKRGKKLNNKHLYNKIKQILNDDFNVIHEKIFLTDVESVAYEQERKFIDKLGLDNLVNLTIGGRGGLGRPKGDFGKSRIKDGKLLCSSCKLHKEFSEFHKDKYSKNKHKSICKECRKGFVSHPHNKLHKERKIFDRNVNNSIYRSIKLNKSGRIWERVLGYTLNDLKKHLELQFLIEMNWNNFGSYWWIDKIIPGSAFDYKNITSNELSKCWSLKNIRPLYKIECIKKRNKVIWHLIDEYKLYDILPIGLIKIDKE